MTSSVFSLQDPSFNDEELVQHAACANCHQRKIRCIAGPGSCQMCSALRIECKQRERSKGGRPRGSQQNSWKAERISTWRQRRRPSTTTTTTAAASTSASNRADASTVDHIIQPSPLSESTTTNNNNNNIHRHPPNNPSPVRSVQSISSLQSGSNASSNSMNGSNNNANLTTNPHPNNNVNNNNNNNQANSWSSDGSTDLPPMHTGFSPFTSTAGGGGHEHNKFAAYDPTFDFSAEMDTHTPFNITEDVDLYDMHCKIRHLLQDSATTHSPGANGHEAKDEACMSALEEFSEALHDLPWYRPMCLLAIAVMWDAVELVTVLASGYMANVTGAPSPALSGAPSSTPNGNGNYNAFSIDFAQLTNTLQSQYQQMQQHQQQQTPQTQQAQQQQGQQQQQQQPQQGHQVGATPSSAATSASARGLRRSSVIALTRLDLCLGDFACFVKSFESFAGESVPRVVSPASSCRTRIARIHEQIYRCLQISSHNGSRQGLML